MTRQTRRALRQQVDRRSEGLRDHLGLERPAGGWLRTVREALGMTAEQLGHRLGTSRQAVSLLERSEVEDSIRLGSVRRAAEALDCDLVYALVPKTSLEDTVQRQARRVAEKEMDPVIRSLLTEPRWADTLDREELVAARAVALVDARSLWRSRMPT